MYRPAEAQPIDGAYLMQSTLTANHLLSQPAKTAEAVNDPSAQISYSHLGNTQGVRRLIATSQCHGFSGRILG
jgi:hypothetical protein